MSIVALMLALMLPQESPLPMLEIGTLTNSGYVSVLAMDKAGHWVGGVDQKGRISSEDLARVAAAINGVMLTTYDGPECPTPPILQLLRIDRGEVRFSMDCGRLPHYTVRQLIKLAESLTIRENDPMLVRVERWRHGDEARKEVIMLRRDGVWSADNKVGNTGGPTLAELVAAFSDPELDLSLSDWTPTCRGDYIHELELPKRGTVRWIAPCQHPSASLSAALDKLFKLVGVSR